MGINLSGCCDANFQVTGKGNDYELCFPPSLWGAKLRLNGALFSQLPPRPISMISI